MIATGSRLCRAFSAARLRILLSHLSHLTARCLALEEHCGKDSLSLRSNCLAWHFKYGSKWEQVGQVGAAPDRPRVCLGWAWLIMCAQISFRWPRKFAPLDTSRGSTMRRDSADSYGTTANEREAQRQAHVATPLWVRSQVVWVFFDMAWTGWRSRRATGQTVRGRCCLPQVQTT